MSARDDSESLFADTPGIEVDPDEVEAFIALAEAGVLSRVQPLCNAVQNNQALRRGTRVSLEPPSEPDV